VTVGHDHKQTRSKAGSTEQRRASELSDCADTQEKEEFGELPSQYNETYANVISATERQLHFMCDRDKDTVLEVKPDGSA
jgi:hypothetical protein